MKEVIIDMDRIRKALPERAHISIVRFGKVPYIRIEVYNPSLYDGTKSGEQDIEMVKNWLRDIIGSENISEIYSESTGTQWNVYLKRNIITFQNM